MMKTFILLINIFFITAIHAEETTSLHSNSAYTPLSGDTEIDASLIALNTKIKGDMTGFGRRLSELFQVPEDKVSVLFSQYEFTPADVLMTLSIADSSGQPVNNVARTYFDNKSSGWEYTMYQLKISKKSVTFKQIKKDAQAEY